MPPVKPLSKISKKWTDRVSVSQGEYSDGVQNPRRDWATEAEAAEERYKAGIQSSIQAGSRVKGIKRVGTNKWQEKAIKKGPGRWQEGVSLGKDDYEAGFAPFREVIEKATLPPRYAAGDPRNYDRVKAIGQALNAKKLSG